jgi:predicted nucleotidyltransferase
VDKADALNIAKTYARLVKQKFDPQQIILFGSYIKGTYHEESDIDIAVIFSDYDDSIDMQLELMRLRRKIDSRIEPHPFKERDFNLFNPFAAEILKYGEKIEILSSGKSD